MSTRTKGAALALNTFFGLFGADRFYLGETGSGWGLAGSMIAAVVCIIVAFSCAAGMIVDIAKSFAEGEDKDKSIGDIIKDAGSAGIASIVFLGLASLILSVMGVWVAINYLSIFTSYFGTTWLMGKEMPLGIVPSGNLAIPNTTGDWVAISLLVFLPIVAGIIFGIVDAVQGKKGTTDVGYSYQMVHDASVDAKDSYY